MMPAATFVVTYDFRVLDAWEQANIHRSMWGKLYTDIAILDNDHVALTFRPAPDPRWRPWEEVRKSWILKGAA